MDADTDRTQEPTPETAQEPIAGVFLARVTFRGTEAAPPTIAQLVEDLERAAANYGLQVRITAERVDR